MSALFRLHGRVSWLVPLLLTMALVFGLTAFTQNGTEPNEGCELIAQNTPGDYGLYWWGKTGRTYFIQCSEDLETWTYMPVIESGQGEVTEYGLQSNGTRFFLRLKYTDVPTGPDPGAEDFDTDDLSSMDELTLYNTDPLNADTDDDGYSDGLEVRVGSSPTLIASTPIQAVAAQLATVQSAITTYQTLTQSGAGYAEVLAAFNSLKDQIDELQDNLDDIDDEVPGSPTSPTRESADDAEDDLGDPPEEPLSTGYLEARGISAHYGDTTLTVTSQNWQWDGAVWNYDSAGSGSVTYPPSITNNGWENTSGEGGSISSLTQARNPPGDKGEFVGYSGVSNASGSYQEDSPGVGTQEPPSEPGEYVGQWYYQSTDSTLGQSFEFNEFELRLSRSAEGRRDNPIEQHFVIETVETSGGSTSTSYRIETLQLGAGQNHSTETVLISGKTVTPNTSRVERIAVMRVKEVKLVQPAAGPPADHPILKSDDGLTTYSGDQWVDSDGNGIATANAVGSGDVNRPVAFKRGSAYQVTASFAIPGLKPTQVVEVKGEVHQRGGTNVLPITPLIRGSDGVTYGLGPTGNSNFENAVRCYNGTAPDGDSFGPLKIVWSIKIDGGAFKPIGVSRHTVYLTYNTPDSAVDKETLFYIGCRYAPPHPPATPAGEESVVNGIYSHFETRQVFKVKPSTATPQTKAMTYWKTGLYTTTAELLEHRDGQCNSWASLFRDILLAQGINSEVKVIYPPVSAGFAAAYQTEFSLPANGVVTERVFFVKDWNSTGPKEKEFPSDPTIQSRFYPEDLAGIPAQGDPDPDISFYANHRVVQYDSKLYDPSYGSPKCNNLKEWEDQSLAGFGVSYGDGNAVVKGKRFYVPGQTSYTHLWFQLLNGANVEECTMP